MSTFRWTALHTPRFWPSRGVCGLTNRSSGRVNDKVPSSYVGVRAAQLNR